MAFRKKAGVILAHKPDILVIPECEHPDKLKFNPQTPEPNDMLWFGTNQNKGLGIFSYSDYTFKLIRTYDPGLKMIVPVAVSGGQFSFNLYAIWANNPADPDGQYVTQVWKAIRHYDRLLSKKHSILIGDFNSNTIWDKPRREGNHSTVVKRLEEKGIHSVYHKHFKQIQGKEQHPTLYLYKHKDKPYHIDYCFASKAIADKLHSVEIGDYDCWMQYSDHVPVIVTFKYGLPVNDQ
jgi:exonuclease III